ncbi:MAG: hypothetical protein IT374_01125 [Polyangiaceae bacterium]|nr:hypothetical protein [Polyangiaceae bacterium]
MFLAYRLFKLLSVAAALGGTLAVCAVERHEEARRIGLRVAVPGLCAAWVFGFLLAYETSASLLSTWILSSLATSFFALQALLFSLGRAERRRTGSIVALTLLLVTLALMVWRPA